MKRSIPSEVFPQLAAALPPSEHIFRAFDLCPLETAKVVILGQDPYPTPGNANGLAFSVHKGQPLPVSLKNIYKELVDDIGCAQPEHGDLTCWAEQGVLLANTALTVLPSQPDAHTKVWKPFTREWIREAGSSEAVPKVWIMWGRKAQAFIPLIDQTRHRVIQSFHPGPLGVYRGFYGSKPFSKANAALRELGLAEIDWAVR